VPKTLSEAEVAEFRARLCETAARMFVEKGPEAVTMRTLAKELGCSAMTPYRYFKDKQAILAAVRAKGFDELAAALATIRHSPGDESANASLLGQVYLAFAFERPHVYRMMFDFPQPRDSGESADVEKARERARLMLAPSAAHWAAAELAKSHDRLSHMLLSTLHGAAMLQLSGILKKDCAEQLGCQLLLAVLRAYPESA
jgi:AcrR family transcriptional regulator